MRESATKQPKETKKGQISHSPCQKGTLVCKRYATAGSSGIDQYQVCHCLNVQEHLVELLRWYSCNLYPSAFALNVQQCSTFVTLRVQWHELN